MCVRNNGIVDEFSIYTFTTTGLINCIKRPTYYFCNSGTYVNVSN